MKKIFPFLLFIIVLSGCTQSGDNILNANQATVVVNTVEIVHEVEQKIIPTIGVWSGFLDNETIASSCRQVQEDEDWTKLPVIAPYICTNLPIYIHSYIIPSLNLKGWIYDARYYEINDYSAQFYLTTGDYSTFVVSGDMLIDNFMAGLSKDPLGFNDYEFYIEKKYFGSGEIKQDVLDTIGNTQLSGYLLEPNSLITGLQTAQRYDGNYDIYQISYRMNPERKIFPLMAVTYIFSPQDKNYYYIEYSKSDGGTWFKTEINRLQLFVE